MVGVQIGYLDTMIIMHNRNCKLLLQMPANNRLDKFCLEIAADIISSSSTCYCKYNKVIPLHKKLYKLCKLYKSNYKQGLS